jgi:hypothetical protein
MAKATSELASVPTLGTPTESPKKASSKKAKKEPEFYIFRLVEEHAKAHPASSPYPPVFTIPNSDTILWNYGTEENPDIQPREIRFVDGMKTIFVDEQEKNGTALADSVLAKQSSLLTFEQGFLKVDSWNKQKYQYLLLSNQCEQNTNKFKMIKNTYKLLDFGNNDDKIIELGKKKDRAYDLARSASEEDMIPHAKFLGIPFIHASTGEERDMYAIREDYKAKALESPTKFLDMANNPKIKLRFLIEKGLEKGIVTTGIVKNQAHWVATRQLITNLPDNAIAIDSLTEFASTEDGAGFVSTLKMQL